MKKTIIIISSLIGIIVVLSIVQISISNAFSTDGITLGKMQEKIAQIEKENMMLKEQLYTKSAYTTIQASASAEGFVENKSSIVLGGVQPLAIRQ
ncbi:MAG TPA: hypothetical protein VF189_00340 [Patescibacteria group bacterium]